MHLISNQIHRHQYHQVADEENQPVFVKIKLREKTKSLSILWLLNGFKRIIITMIIIWNDTK